MIVRSSSPAGMRGGTGRADPGAGALLGAGEAAAAGGARGGRGGVERVAVVAAVEVAHVDASPTPALLLREKVLSSVFRAGTTATAGDACSGKHDRSGSGAEFSSSSKVFSALPRRDTGARGDEHESAGDMYPAEWCCMCNSSDAVPLRLCALLEIELAVPTLEARPRLSTLSHRELALELEPVHALDTEPAPDRDGDAPDPPTVGLCKCAMPGVPGVWGCKCLNEKFLPAVPDLGGVSTAPLARPGLLREERERPEVSGVVGVAVGGGRGTARLEGEVCADGRGGRPSERDSGELPSPADGAAAAAVAAATSAAEAA